jgi:hypothetical protein
VLLVLEMELGSLRMARELERLLAWIRLVEVGRLLELGSWTSLQLGAAEAA